MKRAILVIPDVIRREYAEAAETWINEFENRKIFKREIDHDKFDEKTTHIWITNSGCSFKDGEQPMTSWLVEIKEKSPAEKWVDSTYDEPVIFGEYDMIKAFEAGQKCEREQNETKFTEMYQRGIKDAKEERLKEQKPIGELQSAVSEFINPGYPGFPVDHDYWVYLIRTIDKFKEILKEAR